jgi:hypothetical protein
MDRTTAQVVSRRLSTEGTWFRSQVMGHMGFVMGRVALGRVFYEHFGYLCNFSLYRMLHDHLSSPGVGTIDPTVAGAPIGLSLTSPHGMNKKIHEEFTDDNVSKIWNMWPPIY